MLIDDEDELREQIGDILLNEIIDEVDDDEQVDVEAVFD